MAGQKADKLTKERRIEAVYRLMLDGWSDDQIRQNVAGWELSDRQMARYMADARQRIEEVAAPERAAHHARAVAAHFQMLREARTVREKTAVWAALAKLLGLYAPESVIVKTWQDEVVELLRDGRIAPDDVRVAFPDVAAEFFARAGLRIDTND